MPHFLLNCDGGRLSETSRHVFVGRIRPAVSRHPLAAAHTIIPIPHKIDRIQNLGFLVAGLLHWGLVHPKTCEHFSPALALRLAVVTVSRSANHFWVHLAHMVPVGRRGSLHTAYAVGIGIAQLIDAWRLYTHIAEASCSSQLWSSSRQSGQAAHYHALLSQSGHGDPFPLRHHMIVLLSASHLACFLLQVHRAWRIMREHELALFPYVYTACAAVGLWFVANSMSCCIHSCTSSICCQHLPLQSGC